MSLTPPFAEGQSFSVSGNAYTSIVSIVLLALGGQSQRYVNSYGSGKFSANTAGTDGDLVMRLWTTQNTTRILDNMSIYITNSLRANQSALLPPYFLRENIDPGTSVNGNVWVPRAYVQVEWAWLALPILLCILAGVL